MPSCATSNFPVAKRCILRALRQQNGNVFSQIDQMGRDRPAEVEMRVKTDLTLRWWMIALTVRTAYPWEVVLAWCRSLEGYVVALDTKGVARTIRVGGGFGFIYRVEPWYEHRATLQVPVQERPPKRMAHVNWEFSVDWLA